MLCFTRERNQYDSCSRLTGTASFASYVSLTIKKSTDPLLVAEAWDYLRDVVLIIATGRLEECDDDLGGKGYLITDPATTPVSSPERKTLDLVNVTEKICAGLEAVLKRSDVSVGPLFETLSSYQTHY